MNRVAVPGDASCPLLVRGVDRLLHTEVVGGAEDSRVEIAGAAATWPTLSGSVETAVNSAVARKGSCCNFGKESITTSTYLTAGEVSKRYKGRGRRSGAQGWPMSPKRGRRT